MISLLMRHQPLALLACAFLPLAGVAAPLSLPAALDLAERSAPQLAAQRAAVFAARATAVAAGELPDPQLAIGIDNLPARGADRWRLNRDGMTMQTLGVMQAFPNADKRRARTEAADALTLRRERETTIARLAIRRDTAQAWLMCYYLERKLALFDALVTENRLLADAVRARFAGGLGMPAEVLMPREEAAMLAERRDELVRDLGVARAQLRRWVGPEGDAPLVGDPPRYAITPDRLAQGWSQRPELAVYGPMTAQAEAELREARAAQRPDWGVSLSYQRRASGFGDMVSVQLSMDLPLFQSTRQQPQVAARRAELTRIDAEREALLRELQQQLEADLAEAARLDRALTRQAEELVPLAQQRVDLQMASYRAGKLDLSELIAARRALIEARLKQIELDAQRAQLATRLHFSLEEDAQ